jgi:uncharacterized protein YndB with AHSA1/START domain
MPPAMRALTVNECISAPRELIFDYVADLSGRPAWCDHYMTDYRLARVNPRGRGAAARFLLKPPGPSQWAEIVINECDRPRRIVEHARVGRLGRSHGAAVYEFVEEMAGVTRVELTVWIEPANRLDALKQALGRAWLKRQMRTALRRLRLVFEEPREEPLARATIAGYEPLKAARFGG